MNSPLAFPRTNITVRGVDHVEDYEIDFNEYDDVDFDVEIFMPLKDSSSSTYSFRSKSLTVPRSVASASRIRGRNPTTTTATAGNCDCTCTCSEQCRCRRCTYKSELLTDNMYGLETAMLKMRSTWTNKSSAYSLTSPLDAKATASAGAGATDDEHEDSNMMPHGDIEAMLDGVGRSDRAPSPSLSTSPSSPATPLSLPDRRWLLSPTASSSSSSSPSSAPTCTGRSSINGQADSSSDNGSGKSHRSNKRQRRRSSADAASE